MVATSIIIQLIALATHTVGKEAANFGFETLLIQSLVTTPDSRSAPSVQTVLIA